jgi:PIN domain nuclease of toxin-antitoxin system
VSDQVVLDSSALLALLGDEPGADDVAALLPRAIMSVVNVAEVLIVLARHGVARADAEEIVSQLALRLVPADARVARTAAAIAAASRSKPIALGDRFCLATAQLMNLPAVTADRAWLRLDAGVKIQTIR